MWCETEIKRAVCFIPGYTGFCPGYSEQIGKSYGHQTHHLMNEHPHLQDRLSNTGRYPHVRVEVKPDRYERGDNSERYEKCATCTYERGATCHDRNVRPAGLSSAEMWKAMDTAGKREKLRQVANEKETRSRPQRYYSRHESHFPPDYFHYEGFRDEHEHRHHVKSHHRGHNVRGHHPAHHEPGHGHRYHERSHYRQDHPEKGPYRQDRREQRPYRQDHRDQRPYSQDHHHHGHYHHDHDRKSNKYLSDIPITVSICIAPRKPKEKFYTPSACGDYDREKEKVCSQLPYNKQCKKGEGSGDRMHCHSKAYVKSDRDRGNDRCYYPQTPCSDGEGRKSQCRSTSGNKEMQNYIGFVGGIQLIGPMNCGDSSRRLWRGNCC